MKPDIIISKEIAAVLVASYQLGIANIHPAQAAADIARPLLSVTGEWQQYGEKNRKGTLTLELRSRTGDEGCDNAEHEAMFEALLYALLGSDTVTRAAAKITFIQALATRAVVNIQDYGPKEIVSDVDGDDLRTQFTLNMVWKFV